MNNYLTLAKDSNPLNNNINQLCLIMIGNSYRSDSKSRIVCKTNRITNIGNAYRSIGLTATSVRELAVSCKRTSLYLPSSLLTSNNDCVLRAFVKYKLPKCRKNGFYMD